MENKWWVGRKGKQRHLFYPSLTNTVSYSVTGESVDSDSESEPKGGGVRGGFGLVCGRRQLWLKHCILMRWSNFSVSLLIKRGFAPQLVCCGLCVVHCGSSKLNALLQGAEKSEPPQKEQSYRVLKLNFLPTPLPLSLLWYCSVVEDLEALI